MIRIRCAIYTRKSSDEGLEKEFNSLDAQREACEAFIKSQKHAGWVAVSDLYDDGGLSGGTLERPALQRLLGDIMARKVQIVVVYKVDRLTRSLADFAKIVDIFDAHGASFVSVTQQFNTTTSMGRLTLNMLLSFAQFEREIAGERIRDKIAASKAKGMWMGGTVPLGYNIKERKLVINEAEAETVRLIYQRYAELASVNLLQAELDRRGLHSKRRAGAKGLIAGGATFSRGVLYLILQNRLYRGEIAHKGNVYPGQHQAIIDGRLWDAVQEKLAANRKARFLATGAQAPSLLSGLLFDDSGTRMTPTHANKRGRRYRYYISAALLDPRKSAGSSMRVPASEVEGVVVDRVRTLLGSRKEIADALAALELRAGELEAALNRAAEFGKKWLILAPEAIRDFVRQTIARVTISLDQIEIVVDAERLAGALGVQRTKKSVADHAIVLTVPAALHRSGRGKRMVVGDPPERTPDAALIQVLREAFTVRQKMLADTTETLYDITAGITKSKGRLTALMRLTYLSPSIIEDILGGRQPPELSPKRLLRTSQNLPLDWTEQRKVLGFA